MVLVLAQPRKAHPTRLLHRRTWAPSFNQSQIQKPEVSEVRSPKPESLAPQCPSVSSVVKILFSAISPQPEAAFTPP